MGSMQWYGHIVRKGSVRVGARVSAAIMAIAVLLVASLQPLGVSAFAGGNGSAGSPYLIASCADFASITNLTAHYKLTQTLDCTATGNGIVIGDSGAPFAGTLDGNKHGITVAINITGTGNVGLFGYTQGATIRDLHIEGSVAGDTNNIGMLAGVLSASTVERVSASGTVTSTAGYVGGLFGRAICSSLITGISVDVDVTGANYVGGAIGRDIGGSAGFGDCGGSAYGSTITDSAAFGDVTGADYVGGFIGIAYDTTLTRVSASGSVSGNDNIGGLVGYSARFGSQQFFAVSATGLVTGRYSLGGLVGHMPGGEIVQSFATGSIVGSGGDDIGGLVGRAVLGGTVYIRNSYSRSTINTGGGGDAGSVVGYGTSFTRLINSYGTGQITTSVAGGGLHGAGLLAEATNTFWDTQTTGMSAACSVVVCPGTGATTAQMKTKATFTSATWDFTDVWGIQAGVNDGYPYLLAHVSFLCEQPEVTASSGRVACELTYQNASVDGSAYTWQARYRKVGDASWTNAVIDDDTEGRMVFLGLLPGTDYELGVKPTSNVFAHWAVNEVTTFAISSDVDADGTPDVTENSGPNKGDTDNDGVLDALQAGITTLSNALTNKYTVLKSSCSTNTTVSVVPESTANKDAGYDYAAGLVSFTATGCGSTATFTQYFYGSFDTSKLTARKYNTTTRAYTTIPGAVLTSTTIGGQSVLKVVYQITDNSALDENPTVGTITDPAGPGVVTVNAPNTGIERIL